MVLAMPDQYTAREYLRVSQDRSGKLQSPAEQHRDNERAATDNGWRLGEPYAERQAVSASRYSSKARAAFDRLTADLAAGAFGARILILWESSRGSREVGEWVTLINACEDHGVLIHVTTHHRTYDPGNARDRRALLEDAVDSEYESAKTSLRIRRTMTQMAAAGKPNGIIPFGYTREYHPLTRQLVSQDPHPGEAPVIAELYERLRKRESLNSIMRDWAERGITSRTGKRFSAAYLRHLALNPSYAGLRIHRPVDTKGRPSGDRYSTDSAVPAAWPPLVEPAVWHEVRALLTDPSRRTSRPGRGKHLLSMIARCGQCGGEMTAGYPRGEREYICRQRSCTRILAGLLDTYAEDVMLAWLTRDDVVAALRAATGDNPELRQVREDLAKACGELAQWKAGAASGKVTFDSFAAVEPGVRARISGLERRERELGTPPALAWLIQPGQTIPQVWAGAVMAAKRTAARQLCSPAILGTLLVMPVDKRRWMTGDAGRMAGGETVPAAQRTEWQKPDHPQATEPP